MVLVELELALQPRDRDLEGDNPLQHPLDVVRTLAVEGPRLGPARLEARYRDMH